MVDLCVCACARVRVRVYACLYVLVTRVLPTISCGNPESAVLAECIKLTKERQRCTQASVNIGLRLFIYRLLVGLFIGCS